LYGHHTYLKSLGGHADQEVAKLLPELHVGKLGVHADLARFEGGWLNPRKGMSGAEIVDRYGVESIEEGLTRFYSQDRWKHSLETYKKAIGFTKLARQSN
jgi:hypothetical protein